MVRTSVDVETSVEVAWRAFEHRLAAVLVELGPGEGVRVGVPTGRGDRSPVSLRVRRRPRTLLVNAVGAPPISGAGSLALRRPPAGVPTSKVFRAGTEPALASWVTHLLRTAYEVIHPSFLVVTRAGGAATDPRAAAGLDLVPRGAPTAHPFGTGAGPGATQMIMPTTPDELDDMVVRTLETVLRRPVAHDADGDIEIDGSAGTVYVRVRPDQPVVEVFTLVELLDGPDALEAAAVVANAHNTTSTLVTYVVMGGALVARAAVLCRPYQPTLVLAAVAALMQTLVDTEPGSAEPGTEESEDDAGEDDGSDHAGRDHDGGDHDGGTSSRLRVLPSGASSTGSGGDAEPLAAELLTIMQLEAAEPGSVPSSLAARIFGYDRDLLLACIREAEQQALAWRRATGAAEAADGDEAEAVVCAKEVAAWHALVDLLRAALRLTVER